MKTDTISNTSGVFWWAGNWIIAICLTYLLSPAGKEEQVRVFVLIGAGMVFAASVTWFIIDRLRLNPFLGIYVTFLGSIVAYADLLPFMIGKPILMIGMILMLAGVLLVLVLPLSAGVMLGEIISLNRKNPPDS